MRIRFWLLPLIYLLTTVAVAQADVDTRVLRTLQLKTTPLDMAVPGNGRYIYILTSDAKLKIFRENGSLRDTLAVDPGVDRIKPGPKEDRLFLINSASNQIQVLKLDFVHVIPVDGSPTKGSADAVVKVMIFTDFQCPYCARVAPILEQLLEKYPTQVQLVFKNYPLRSHKFAKKAAAAALAAHAQGRFWEFHDALFASYNKLNESKVEEIRASLNLDKKDFSALRKSPQITGQIQKDIKWAREAGITGTPSIFVNGRLQKKRTLKKLSEAVETELQRLEK